MIKKLPLRPLAIIVTSLCAVAGISATAVPVTVPIELFRLPQLDGSTKFEMNVQAGNVLVHLPNGESRTSTLPPQFVFDSFSELKEAIVGEWTIETAPFLPHETFTFNVSDFPESVLDIVPPTIVSPTNGSHVSPQFTMTWAWPPGVTPQNSKSTRITKLPRGSQRGSASTSSNDLSEVMSAAYSGGLGVAESVEIRAGSYHPKILNQFFSEVTPHQAPSIFSYKFDTYYHNYSLPVQALVGVPGDYNDDGVVDAADFTVWRNYKGTISANLPADGNNNGEVDLGDYEVWRAHFGLSVSSGSFVDNAVPEPSTWLFMISAALSLPLRRRFH